jgi:phospholipid-binding lipoprotein MlaA
MNHLKHSQTISQYIQARHHFIVFFLALVLFLTGCATSKEPMAQQSAINSVDPYENVNRKVYIFNDAVDDYLSKPISDAYKYITPKFVQIGISNFFNNVQTINVVFNDLLQAKFAQGTRDTQRFFMNSTLGLAGFFDVAKAVGLEQTDEDFEQTLAVWGVPQGYYLVIPFLGPITVRGIPGAMFDTAANPISYLGVPLLSNYIGIPIQAISLVNKRANAEGAIQFIDEAALDPYVFTRESFLQWRSHLASDGKPESTTDLIDIEEQIEEGK